MQCWIIWVTRFTALTSCPPVGGAVHYSDRVDFLKILFHIRPERLERDRCCQGVMDEPLLKGHQGNNRQLSEPWKQQVKPRRSSVPLSSPQLSDWKMSAIRNYVNVKVVPCLIWFTLKQLWQSRWTERAEAAGGRVRLRTDGVRVKSRKGRGLLRYLICKTSHQEIVSFCIYINFSSKMFMSVVFCARI